MKKLLLLLLPFMSFAQDIYLDHSYINANPIIVGDTLSIKFNTLDNNDTSFNFLQLDYQYNNKLLQKVDHTFYTDGVQTSLNHWDGYKFNPNPDKSVSDLSSQFSWWAGGASGANTTSYNQSSDWSVERITLQHSSAIPHNDTFIIVRFVVKDIANTNYDDYKNVSELSWARANNNSTGDSYTINAMTQHIDLNQIQGGGAGDVVLKLQTQAEQKESYMYSITENNTEIASGSFDVNGEAIVTDLVNDTEYNVQVFVTDENDWLGDVVSITDAYMLFLEAINGGDDPTSNTNSNLTAMQKVVMDVNNDGSINFDDSYALLMHVIGESLDNTYITQDSLAYNISELERVFKPKSDDKTFNVRHYFAGDADFSHSYYSEEVETAAFGLSRQRFSLAKQNIVQHDLDLTTELIDGKIEFTVNLDRSDLSAIEFIVNYDNTKLTFDKIIFNAGDNITNYSTKKDGAVYFGSIDPEAQLQIKTGQSYKIVFNPKVQVTNAAGLIYFKRQEAVTTQGQKINLNLK